jgi:Flagellar hook-length control protein FliK
MPSRVSFSTESVTPKTGKTSSFFIPRRNEVMQSLQPGQRLTVQVLERFASGKVMLDVKGAAVTAQSKGDFPVGAKIEVDVQPRGQGFVLRRVGGDTSVEESLMRFVRGRLGGLEERNTAILQGLTGRALTSLADAKEGLAGLYARLGKLLTPLLSAEKNLASNLESLATLLGAAPASAGDRVREFLGVNLPGLLDRMLGSGKQDFAAVLQRTGGLNLTEAEKLTTLAGALKEQIGLFRGLNALLESRSQPLYLALPLMHEGQPQPTELWMYKRHDAEHERDDPEATSAVVRLTLTNLGEVRAHVVVSGQAARVGVFTEMERTAELVRQARGELEGALREAGLQPTVAVRQGLDARPLPRVEELVFAAGEKRNLDVKA